MVWVQELRGSILEFGLQILNEIYDLENWMIDNLGLDSVFLTFINIVQCGSSLVIKL